MDTSLKPVARNAEETLDPEDWAGVQTLSHQVIDDAVGYLRDVRERPVWQDMPAGGQGFLRRSLAAIAGTACRRLSRGNGYGDVLSHGQHPSAFLVLVHGLEQLYRRAWAIFWRPSRALTLAAATMPPL